MAIRSISREPIKVFIKVIRFQGKDDAFEIISKFPKERIINRSWKGFYYIIEKGESFFFDRCNNWDLSYFKLNNGVEFVVPCTNLEVYLRNRPEISMV